MSNHISSSCYLVFFIFFLFCLHLIFLFLIFLTILIFITSCCTLLDSELLQKQTCDSNQLPSLPMLHVSTIVCHTEQFKNNVSITINCTPVRDPTHGTTLVVHDQSLSHVCFQTILLQHFLLWRCYHGSSLRHFF